MNHIYDLGVNYDESEMTHIVSDERWWVILITLGIFSHIEIFQSFLKLKFHGRTRVFVDGHELTRPDIRSCQRFTDEDGEKDN